VVVRARSSALLSESCEIGVKFCFRRCEKSFLSEDSVTVDKKSSWFAGREKSADDVLLNERCVRVLCQIIFSTN
jgi:hypothetical protein